MAKHQPVCRLRVRCPAAKICGSCFLASCLRPCCDCVSPCKDVNMPLLEELVSRLG